MPDEFASAKAHAKELEQNDNERNKIFEEMENLYWMRWAEEDVVAKQMKNNINNWGSMSKGLKICRTLLFVSQAGSKVEKNDKKN